MVDREINNLFKEYHMEITYFRNGTCENKRLTWGISHMEITCLASDRCRNNLFEGWYI